MGRDRQCVTQCISSLFFCSFSLPLCRNNSNSLMRVKSGNGPFPTSLLVSLSLPAFDGVIPSAETVKPFCRTCSSSWCFSPMTASSPSLTRQRPLWECPRSYSYAMVSWLGASPPRHTVFTAIFPFLYSNLTAFRNHDNQNQHVYLWMRKRRTASDYVFYISIRVLFYVFICSYSCAFRIICIFRLAPLNKKLLCLSCLISLL